MPGATDPLRVVVAGGGVAGLEALVALRARAGTQVELRLVCPEVTFTLRALGLYERFGIGAARAYALADVAEDLGVALHRDAVHLVRGEDHSVRLQSGAELTFDALVLAVGAFAFPAFGHGVSLADRHDRLDAVIADLRARRAGCLAVVIPVGTGWTLPAYELALTMAADAPGTRITLVTPEAQPLALFGPPASAMIREELSVAGVSLLCGVDADVPEDGVVALGADARRRPITSCTSRRSPAPACAARRATPAGSSASTPRSARATTTSSPSATAPPAR